MFSRLNDWGRLAVCYDRRADVFLDIIILSAILIWWLQ